MGFKGSISLQAGVVEDGGGCLLDEVMEFFVFE